MHVLYVVFRVSLEIFVISAILDLMVTGTGAASKSIKERKKGVAMFTLTYTALVMISLLLRLYVFNPVIE